KVGLRLRHGDAGLEPPDIIEQVHPAILADWSGTIRAGRVFGDCDVELDRFVVERVLKPRRHHAGHGVRTPIESDCAANDIGIGAELLLPAVMRQHDLESARPAAGLLVFAAETSSNYGLNAEDVENVRARYHAEQTLCAFFLG